MKVANSIAWVGVAAVAAGLVLQSFAGTAGLYCFGLGVILLLIFLGIKISELSRESE